MASDSPACLTWPFTFPACLRTCCSFHVRCEAASHRRTTSTPSTFSLLLLLSSFWKPSSINLPSLLLESYLANRSGQLPVLDSRISPSDYHCVSFLACYLSHPTHHIMASQKLEGSALPPSPPTSLEGEFHSTYPPTYGLIDNSMEQFPMAAEFDPSTPPQMVSSKFCHIASISHRILSNNDH